MIKDIIGRKIYDSRGDPTIMVQTVTDKGVFFGSAPSGKSLGKYEAKVLDINTSLKILQRIKSNFIGLREEDFNLLDEMLVQLAGKNFKKIGSHLGFALSSSFLKAATSNEPYKYFDKIFFPYLIGNVIGGGVHGGGTDIQEFHIIPTKVDNFRNCVEIVIKTMGKIKKIFSSREILLGKNDENAWVSPLDEYETLNTISKVAREFGARIGVDMAASEIYDKSKGKYIYKKLGKETTPGEQLDVVKELISTWNLYYVEDPFHEDDFKSFSELTKWKKRILICGDDLFATNIERLKMGIRKSACNSIIIKPNQVGTLGLAIKTAKFASKAGYKTVFSHRSGETDDWIIADLAAGLSPFIKTGVLGGERMTKLNRLIDIWESVSNPKMAKI